MLRILIIIILLLLIIIISRLDSLAIHPLLRGLATRSGGRSEQQLGRRYIFFLPAARLSTFNFHFSPSSSVSMSYFILTVPIRMCSGKHSCMSSTFLIAILNGTCALRSANTDCEKIWKQCADTYLDTWSSFEAANARATLDKQSCVITPTFVYHD